MRFLGPLRLGPHLDRVQSWPPHACRCVDGEGPPGTAERAGTPPGQETPPPRSSGPVPPARADRRRSGPVCTQSTHARREAGNRRAQSTQASSCRAQGTHARREASSRRSTKRSSTRTNRWGVVADLGAVTKEVVFLVGALGIFEKVELQPRVPTGHGGDRAASGGGERIRAAPYWISKAACWIGRIAAGASSRWRAAAARVWVRGGIELGMGHGWESSVDLKEKRWWVPHKRR